MKIGLLCAMKTEFDQLLPYLRETARHEVAKTTVIEGDVNGLPVVLAATGVCKVNAGITAQLLIDRFAVTHIIMVGVAGSMDPRLGIHALAFSQRLAQHDVNVAWLRHRGGIADGGIVQSAIKEPRVLSPVEGCRGVGNEHRQCCDLHAACCGTGRAAGEHQQDRDRLRGIAHFR